MKDQNNISENAPNLERAGRVNPFTIPDEYFRELPNQILQRCRPGVTDQQFNRSLIVAYYRPMLAAVVVVIFVFSAIMLVNHHNTISQVNQQEVAGYVLKEAQSGGFLNDIADSDIYSAPSGENNNLSIVPAKLECSTEEIIDYLLNENLDLETINQQ